MKRPDAFNFDAWAKVREFVEFLERLTASMCGATLGPTSGRPPHGEVLSHSKTASKVRLHAKAYLFRGNETAYAAVGSSNLTRGGLNDNIELNLASTMRERLVAGTESWFDGKWEQGQDCRQEFITDLLEQCVLLGVGTARHGRSS